MSTYNIISGPILASELINTVNSSTVETTNGGETTNGDKTTNIKPKMSEYCIFDDDDSCAFVIEEDNEKQGVDEKQGVNEKQGGKVKKDDEAPEEPKEEPAPKARKIAEDAETEVYDKDLHQDDLLTILYVLAKKKNFSGDHIKSMNIFYREGIKQIITEAFASSTENKFRNERTATQEDQSIVDISFAVDFSNVKMEKPCLIDNRLGKLVSVTPQMARLKNITYSGNLIADIEIKAFATRKDGTVSERNEKMLNFRMASVPCMVGTELDTLTGYSREAKKQHGEDPTDIGGYFIMGASGQGTGKQSGSSNEWYINNIENITSNVFHVYKHVELYKNELVRGNFLSKPGDAFENSYQIILSHLTTGMIYFELNTSKYAKIKIPFYHIYRIFGMMSDVDVMETIVSDDDTPVSRQMKDIVGTAFHVVDKNYAEIHNSMDRNAIIDFLAVYMNQQTNKNVVAAVADENIAKYIHGNFMNLLDKQLLPHVGTTTESRIKKLRFLGHLIGMMLKVELNVFNSTDRDAYKNKRILTAGTTLSKAFKTNFNLTIVRGIKESLTSAFKETSFSEVKLSERVQSGIKSDALEKALVQSIVSGVGDMTVNMRKVVNRVDSSLLYHKNDLNVKASMLNIVTTGSSSALQTTRADEMRRVQPSYVGQVCIVKSAETGPEVGMKKEQPPFVIISSATSSALVKKILLEDPDITPLDKIMSKEIAKKQLAKVFVAGDWIGVCANAMLLARKYVKLRRLGRLDYSTTIVSEVLSREVKFWTDYGRPLMPAIIVYNNIDAYIEASRAGKKIEFRQWIKLTKKHIMGIQAGEITVDDLRTEGVIEYISPEEQETKYFCESYKLLLSERGNVLKQFTHCFIPQQLLGLVALSIPLSDRSSLVRGVKGSLHRRNACGWSKLNFPYVFIKNLTIQAYCEKSLVGSFTDNFTKPNGHNPIVAMKSWLGWNQEDSVCVCQQSVDCCMFNASTYTYESTELMAGESFSNPDPSKTIDLRKDANYDYLVDGIIKRGTVVYKNYVLVHKIAKLPKKTDSSIKDVYTHVDRSLFAKSGPLIVEDVSISREGTLIKVKLRSLRPLEVGDKLSSRHGNKGIVSLLIDRADMPYTEDGIVPDILVSPQSIPTRGNWNQAIELVMSVLACYTGCLYDATVFKELSVPAILVELEKIGIKNAGMKRMYDGKTGGWFDALIFIGPTTYQRISKFVIDDRYTMRTGPVSAMTKQPVDGKAQSGGLKIDEMFKDALVAEGAMESFYEKYYEDSDGCMIYICRVCGEKAIVNEQTGKYHCKVCLYNADICAVKSSWTANLFQNILEGMNVKMKFEMDPLAFQSEK